MRVPFQEDDGRIFTRLGLENVEVQVVAWGYPDDLAKVIVRLPAYAAIEHANGIFDGQKARLRLERIGFRPIRLSTAPARLRSAFTKWKTANQTALNVTEGACEILCS